MRLTTEFFVSSLIRRAELEGASCFVERKGDAKSGSIALKIERQDRLVTLLMPLSYHDLSEDDTSARRFTRVFMWENEEKINDKLKKEVKIDPDLWVITIEDKKGREFVETL